MLVQLHPQGYLTTNLERMARDNGFFHEALSLGRQSQFIEERHMIRVEICKPNEAHSTNLIRYELVKLTKREMGFLLFCGVIYLRLWKNFPS